MGPLDNTEQVKRIIQESQTYPEINVKLGYTKHHSHKWIVDFMKKHKLKMKPLEFF